MVATVSTSISRNSCPLDERAVSLAGDLFVALEDGDAAKATRLLPAAHTYRDQLQERLRSCTTQSRLFLSAALGHLERAIADAEMPKVEAPAPTFEQIALPFEKEVPCPFCGKEQGKQSDGSYRCQPCHEWIQALRAKQCKALVVAPPHALIPVPIRALVVYNPLAAKIAAGGPGLNLAPLTSAVFAPLPAAA